MNLYKYIEEKYKEQFRLEGTLLLSPLRFYRSVTDTRRDTDEGTKITVLTPTEGMINIPQGDFEKYFGRQNAVTISHGGSLRLNTHVPTAYVVCTSKRLGRDLMRRFNCDSYFQITKPNDFAALIGRSLALQKKVKEYFSAPVRYVREREQRIGTKGELDKKGTSLRTVQVDDYLVKPKSYSHECEYRFVFIVDEPEPLERLTIQCNVTEVNLCCKF